LAGLRLVPASASCTRTRARGMPFAQPVPPASMPAHAVMRAVGASAIPVRTRLVLRLGPVREIREKLRPQYRERRGIELVEVALDIDGHGAQVCHHCGHPRPSSMPPTHGRADESHTRDPVPAENAVRAGQAACSYS
jgi:hypothetical protein